MSYTMNSPIVDPRTITWTQVSDDPFDAKGEIRTAPKPTQMIISSDLGKQRDRSAIVVARISKTAIERYKLERTGGGGAYQIPGTSYESSFEIFDVVMPPVGTDYATVARLLADVRLQVIQDPKFQGLPRRRPIVCFDLGGVGQAVSEMIRVDAGIKDAIGIQISSAMDPKPVLCKPGTEVNVGKEPLFGMLSKAALDGRIKIYDFPLADELRTELEHVTRTPTASNRTKIEAASDAYHDDITAALALLVYAGSNQLGPNHIGSLLTGETKQIVW